MLKEVKYPCFGYPFPGFPEYHKAIYTIQGNLCYFSGIEKGTSTINAADFIISGICAQENRYPSKLRFFDIQTHLGYDSKPSGVWMINELIFEVRPSSGEKRGVEKIVVDGEEGFLFTQGSVNICVKHWHHSPCPVDILDLFRPYIGEPHDKIKCTLCGWEGDFSETNIKDTIPVNHFKRSACPKCDWTLSHWDGWVIK